jgi:hypothetical protein
MNSMRNMPQIEDSNGFPCMDFEHFYQYGVDCYAWGLPPNLVRQAMTQACATWRARGRDVEMWQLRAFVHGTHGNRSTMPVPRFAPAGYEWPCPPDASWKLVVCCYPGGLAELDFLHDVSRRFWSEDNRFLELPYDLRRGQSPTPAWFKRMGFDVLDMTPTASIMVGARRSHLSPVRNKAHS